MTSERTIANGVPVSMKPSPTTQTLTPVVEVKVRKPRRKASDGER